MDEVRFLIKLYDTGTWAYIKHQVAEIKKLFKMIFQQVRELHKTAVQCISVDH